MNLDIALIEKLLKNGNSILDLQVGIVSKVYGDNYEIIAIDDIAYVFKSGDVLKLENTYCRKIFSQGKTIALSEVEGVQGLQKTSSLCCKHIRILYRCTYLQ